MRAAPVAIAALLAAGTITMSARAVDPSAVADESSWVVMDDFEAGSLEGWRAAGGGSGGWFVYTDGDTAPDQEMTSIWPFALPDPPQGRHAAVTDMNGWGTFVTYRDVALEGGFALHLTAFYQSAAPLATAPTLRWDDFTQANQQFRIDILDPSARFDSVADGDVLASVWTTETLGPDAMAPTPNRLDLSELSGRTVRLRLAVASNGAPLRAGVDHIRFEPLHQGAVVRFPSTEPAPGAPEVASLALVEPTGPYSVGRSSIRMGEPPSDELVVSLWYPAADGTGSAAPYLTPERSRQIMLGIAPIYGPAWDVLSTTRTHAVADAEPLDEALPLVVILPGLALPASSLSGLAVDLASRGYAVAAIDHSVGGAGSAGGRANEASLMLDELLKGHQVRIDPDRIGAVGHSLGGEAVAVAVRIDPRFRAGVSLDSTFAPDLQGELERPFLLLDSPAHTADAFSSNWRQLTGWRRWAIVEGTEHMSFTDYPVLVEQLGVDYFSGTISGARSTEIVRSYVAAFMDLHLLGRPERLLDGPAAGFPEVSLQDPDQP